jgi:hypothetical protein
VDSETLVVNIAPNIKLEHIKNDVVDDPVFTGLVIAVTNVWV